MKEDKLDHLFELQSELMKRYGVPTLNGDRNLSKSHKMRWLIDSTVTIAFALNDEVHEFVRELNWKPWKKSWNKMDHDKIKQELVDCWHFLLELTIMWGIDPQELHIEYLKKAGINHDRQDQKY